MNTFNFAAVKLHVFKRLENELPPTLYYHSIDHTRKDVLPHAVRLAQLSDVKGDDLLLLQTAAIYHDIGYVKQYADHEQVGAEIARLELPRFGFTPDAIDAICRMIMATKIPQSASTLMEKILCDADMDSLGRRDFFLTSHSLRYELHEMLALDISLRDWYVRQFNFLKNHQYWTQAAKDTREAGKQHNLAQMRTVLTEQVEL